MNRLELLEREIRGLRAELRALSGVASGQPRRQFIGRTMRDPDTDVYPVRGHYYTWRRYFWIMPLFGLMPGNADAPIMTYDTNDRYDDAPLRVYNLSYPRVHPVENQMVWVFWCPGAAFRWAIAPTTGLANHCVGKITQNSLISAEYTVDSVVALDGFSPVSSSSDTITVKYANFRWRSDFREAPAGREVQFCWDMPGGQWTAYQVNYDPAGY